MIEARQRGVEARQQIAHPFADAGRGAGLFFAPAPV